MKVCEKCGCNFVNVKSKTKFCSSDCSRQSKSDKISKNMIGKQAGRSFAKGFDVRRFMKKDGGHECNVCHMIFESGQHLGGHMKTHKPFDDIRRDGSRKKFLICEHGHQCWVCKNVEWMSKPIPLELDHIDGNPGNNEISNLRLLCPNCHAQTSTYKGKNTHRTDVDNSSRKAMYDALVKASKNRI